MNLTHPTAPAPFPGITLIEDLIEQLSELIQNLSSLSF